MAAGCSPALLPAAPAPAASRRDSPGSSRSGRERSEAAASLLSRRLPWGALSSVCLFI